MGAKLLLGTHLMQKNVPKIKNDQFLLKRSCTLGKLVNTQIKRIPLLCTGKIIFVSVAFLMALSICYIVLNLNELARLCA